MNRRHFLTTSAFSAAALTLPSYGAEAQKYVIPDGKIKLSLKIGMARGLGSTPEEIFSVVKELGYDGIELNSPGGLNKQACLEASKKLNFPIHGVVDSRHWKVKLSDPSAEIREKALGDLTQAINDASLVGGSAVLIVPAVVGKKTTSQEAWDRSIETISKALPLAESKKIHILIENVWNKFLYDHGGDNKQSADQLAKYIDAFKSPWVGSYFDIGNHQKYGNPAEWIRTLDKRIIKLDVKDWGTKAGFSKIGAGDVNWEQVRHALLDIDYSGWATAEVRGGNKERCAEVLQNMRTHLLGK